MIKNNLSTIFTLTIFLSAYLLFLIQPMVGKSLLPVLGGTPSVWNTAMVFFQVLLLAGYLYAHLLVKIDNLKAQFIIHGIVLLTAFLTLPMATSFLPPNEYSSPLLWQLTTMIGMIGLPFFALSTSAPLLQKWFSLSSHPNAQNPYFLYSASNIGSLLALILYPVLVERFLPLPDQTYAFQIGFGFLAVCILICSLSLPKTHTKTTAQIDNSPNPSFQDIATWLFLAFVPSSLMLGFTSYVTTDIGSTPLFWIIPLVLYILSFIFAFATKKIFPLPFIKVSFLILFFAINFFLNMIVELYKWEVAIAHGVLFFIVALMCHQQLDKIKPSTKHLTLFFLVMSVGGALGGIFNALIAPLIFLKPYEYMLVTALALLCWGIGQKHKYIIIVLGLFLMSLHPVIPWETEGKEVIHLSRSYFGTLTVRDTDGLRRLAHGTTIHGSQALDKELKLTPTSYYYYDTAIGESLSEAKFKKSRIDAMVLGLGTGSLLCHLRSSDHLTFIEIDPDIIKIAKDRNFFTYIEDCKTPVTIIQGDARIKLNEEPDEKFDYVLVDVFSSDSIPIHLMTVESTAMYMKKIKKDGLLAFHISNRYMNLVDEVGLIAKSLNVTAYYKFSKSGNIKGSEIRYAPAIVAVLIKDATHAKSLEKKGWKKIDLKDDYRHPWTDTYANPLRALFSKVESRK